MHASQAVKASAADRRAAAAASAAAVATTAAGAATVGATASDAWLRWRSVVATRSRTSAEVAGDAKEHSDVGAVERMLRKQGWRLRSSCRWGCNGGRWPRRPCGLGWCSRPSLRRARGAWAPPLMLEERLCEGAGASDFLDDNPKPPARSRLRLRRRVIVCQLALQGLAAGVEVLKLQQQIVSARVAVASYQRPPVASG